MSGKTGSCPQEIGYANEPRDEVRVSVEDDWWDVHGRIGSFGVCEMEGVD